MLETQTVSPYLQSASIGLRPSYSELATRANVLRLGLEATAANCRSSRERKRLLLLADISGRVYQMLAPARAGVR